jgi:hypothetical protein
MLVFFGWLLSLSLSLQSAAAFDASEILHVKNVGVKIVMACVLPLNLFISSSNFIK